MIVRVSARFVRDEEMIADLVRVAALLGSRTLTREQYSRHGICHPTTIHRRFGSWREACKSAGLDSGRTDLGRPDDLWMTNIYDTWVAQGRQPSYGDMRGSGFSPEGYGKRYGSWTDALRAFESWLARTERDEAQAADERAAVRDIPTGRTPSLRLRFHVLERDRFTCVACGASPAIQPGTVLHVDHVIPFSRGGKTTLDNLQTLCDRCNIGKSDDAPSPISARS